MRSRSPALSQCVCTPCTTEDSPHRRGSAILQTVNSSRKLPVALDEQLIPFAQLLSQLSRLHMKPHLCSKSAFDVCKRASSARASSSLISKESALLWQDVCPPTLEDVLASREDPRQPVHIRLSGRLLTSTSASLKLLIRDCTQYRRPSRHSDWTFMSSSMRLDVIRVCLQRASGWTEPLRSDATMTVSCCLSAHNSFRMYATVTPCSSLF